MRKQKNRKDPLIIRSFNKSKVFSSNDTLQTLESAWNNLPYDMTYEEKIVFFEIAERVVRLHNKIKIEFHEEEESRKN